MAAVAYLIIAFFVAAAVLIVVTALRAASGRFRGRRLVQCPETSGPVYVSLDPTASAVPAAIGWPPDFRIRKCTRWPARRWCGQGCLLEIARAPDTTLMRTIESAWSSGKRCARCGAPVSPIREEKNAPSILSPTHHAAAWKEIEPERVSDVLANYAPLCLQCTGKS